jgi:hypothetical protein
LEPLVRTSRVIWWAFAVAGGGALVAAAVVAIGLMPATLASGIWQLAAGVVILVAIFRGPGFRPAVPFFGAAAGGIILGIAAILLPEEDERIALIAIGIWTFVAGAGYLTIARVARASRVPDGGLYGAAWASLGVGVVTTTVPAFTLGASAGAAAVALAASGAVTILAAQRLRYLPGEAPPVLSKREQRRRERAGGADRG